MTAGRGGAAAKERAAAAGAWREDGAEGKSSGRWDGARGRRRRKEQMQMGQAKGGGCKIISSGR